MKNTLRASCAPLLVAAVAAAFSAPAVAGGRPQDDGHYDQFIVKFKNGTHEHGNAIARQHLLDVVGRRQGLKIGQKRRMAVGADVIRTDRRLDPQRIKQLILALRADPRVEYAEPDLRVYPTLTPNDTSYPSQWHYFQPTAGINAPTAWNRTNGAAQVVAVIDTGIVAHGDLDANVVAGYDFITDITMANDGTTRDANPTDPGDWLAANECGNGNAARNSSWHGTHVAGTIAAVTNNAAGVAGVAYGAKIQPLRVLGKCGGISSDISDAIVWAYGGTVTNVPANPTPANVINLSLGGPGVCLLATYTAIIAAHDAGVTVVVAAGNDNVDAVNFYPANCLDVIAVGAVSSAGQRASFSNHGSTIDIAAPGVDVLSTNNLGTTTAALSSYGYKNGTSMAAPHVAGTAALVRAAAGGAITPAQIEALLKSTSRAMPVACPEGCGAGLLDAGAAVNAVAAPGIVLADAVSVTEGNTGTRTLAFTVSLTRTVATPVTFDFATIGGTASAGSDYVAASATGQVIAAGATSATFQVTVNGDTVGEADEYVHAQISNITGGPVVVDADAAGWILDDDPVALANGVPVPGLAGNEDSEKLFILEVPAGAKDLTFLLDAGTGDADLYVKSGAPPSLVDYDCQSLAGSGSDDSCVMDSPQAGTWYAMVRGFTPYSGASLTGTYTQLLPQALSIADIGIVEGDSGLRFANVTVKLSAPAAVDVTYEIQVANGTATSSDNDFQFAQGFDEFIPAGQTTGTFVVPIIGDSTVEPNEYFYVELSSSNATITDAQAKVNIVNDDGPTLSILGAAVAEGHAGTRTVTLTAQLSEPAAVPVTFNIATSNGTATAGSDYVAKSVTGLTIAAGALSASFTATINGDTSAEPNETFKVTMSNATGASLFNAQGIVTVLNDEGTTLSVSNVGIAEGNSGTKVATFVVSLSQVSASPVTYDIATAASSASAGSDFVAKALVGEIIPAGVLSKTFTVTVNGDVAKEINEFAYVNVSNVTNATVFDGQGRLNIRNDDGSWLTIADASVSEGQSGTKVLTFTVSLNRATTVPVTYDIETGNGSAVAGSDYVARTLYPDTIAAGMVSKTFAVTINGDTAVESNESFTVTIRQGHGATIYDAQATGTITNDD